MAPTFNDLIQSHQFTFFIGKEGKPIVVHAAAISATSQQLDALISNGMGESETRCAKIEDVEVDDFIRFCEYAYRGDYTVPPWEEPSSTLGNDHPNGAENDDWAPIAPRKKKGKKVRAAAEYPPAMDFADEAQPIDEFVEPQYPPTPVPRTLLRAEFDNRNYLIDSGPKSLILQDFEPKCNSAVNQNFTPVLLGHARLYCFAHFRLIAPLKALTLYKLHKTLLGFELYLDRVGDIIELARYAYSNPYLPNRSDDGTLDELKKLIVEYIICEIDTIGKHEEFVKCIEEGGEFVGDFWRMARGYVA